MQPHKTPMVLVSISSTSQYPRFVTYWLSSVRTEQTPPSTTHFHIGRSRRKQSGARIPKGTVIRIFSIKNAWVTTLYPHVENRSRFMHPFLEPGSLGKKSNLYHHKYINRKKYTKKPDGCFFPILFFRKHDCYNQPKYHNNQCPWHILKWLAHICQNLFYNFTPHKFYYSHGSKKIQVYFFISM